MPAGGGLLQLVAEGKQDVFLTGNPQITWFKMVYRRYTNFAIESQAIFFDGDPDFGKRLTCTIPRRGDLLGPLMIEVTLPEVRLTDETLTAYVNSVGHALIEEIVLEIGEQEIDRQTGEWMEIWSELTVPAGQRQGFNAMIGRVSATMPPPTTYPPLTDAVSLYGSYQYGAVKLYIPLQFWFNKNPGLYLPLLAMQYHNVRINVKLRSLAQLVFPFTAGIRPDLNNCPVTKNPKLTKIIDIRMYGDYIHLGVEERRRFTSHSHEYLIEQIQYTPKISIPAANPTATIPIEFNHPVREMIFVLQRDAMTSFNEWFNFSSTSIQEVGGRRDLLQQAVLQLDGYDRFEIRDAGYFRIVQPFQYHTNIPVDQFIYCYSFALKPEELQPSGSLNASRIDAMKLLLAMRPDPASTVAVTDPNYVPPRGNVSIRIYATNHNVLRIVNGFAGLLFKI
jgi:Major capsid protein N-terminus/Large eukaryotic DNA virus major capsid protein